MAADPIVYCLEKVTDYGQFERLCHDLMALEGFPDIDPIGGCKDKGRDAVHISRANPKQVTVFAYSVREDWRKKLEEDSRTIERYGHSCDRLVFLCTASFSAQQRDDAIAFVRDTFGWPLDLYGLERLRVLLATRHRHVLANHPQIFSPALFRTVGDSSETSISALPIDASEARELVEDYSRRFEEFSGHALAPLVATKIQLGDLRQKSDALLDFLCRGQHAQLVGKSGLGKSHLAIHMALSALAAGSLPIIVRAKNYAGKLASLLDESVAHLCPRTAQQFIQAATAAGRALVIVVDGYNECQARLQQEMVEDLAAFFLRCQVPILFTSQEEIALPTELAGDILRLCDLDDDERLAILRTHAANQLPEDILHLCKPFQSAYELSLAASCFAEFDDAPTRTSLFETYVRRCGENVANATLVHRILAELADTMRIAMKSSLSVAESWRIAERVLDEHGASVTVLEDVMRNALLEVRQERCSFRHELLQRFFESVAIVRSTRSIADLTRELRKPLNHALVEFVLDMQTDESAIRQCLQAVVEVGAGADVLARCLRGRFGDLARRVVSGDVTRMFHDADRELDSLDIQLKGDPERRERFLIKIEGGRQWSAYENGLMAAVGNDLPLGMFLEETLGLVSRTEKCCVTILTDEVGPEFLRKRSFRSNLFGQLFVQGAGNRSLPAFILMSAIRTGLIEGTSSETAVRVGELIREPARLTNTEIYVCLSVLDVETTHFEDAIPDLLQHCWDSGVYHLRLKILDRTRAWANRVDEAVHERTTEVLDCLETSNLFLSTSLIEAMFAYGMVESPVSESDAARELREILAAPDSEIAQRAASGAVSRIFEDIFEDAYYRAIEDLPQDEQVRLYTMASLGASKYSDTAWILQRLIESGNESALPAFVRFATTLDGESAFSQETAGQFISAHVGCAQYLERPQSLVDLGTDDLQAWQCYGEILFWLHRPGLTEQEITERCESPWQRLQRAFPLASVDPLMRLAHATMGYRPGQDRPVQTLFLTFRERIRAILEFGLVNREHLSSIDKRFPGHFANRERTTFVVHTLGQIGNADTVQLLVPLTEHTYHGTNAVQAIRRLNAKEPFEGLSVLHRFP